MIRLRVRYYNIIRDLARRPEEVLELPEGAGAADLLREVAARYGEPMRRLLLTADGAKSPYLSLFVNEKRVQVLGPGARLSDGDLVMLLPAIAGGAG